MTPNDIDVLLHYYVSQDPHPRLHAPAVREAITRFLKDGILTPAGTGDSEYDTTTRGTALVKVLCSTTLPTQVLVDKNGEIIDIHP